MTTDNKKEISDLVEAGSSRQHSIPSVDGIKTYDSASQTKKDYSFKQLLYEINKNLER